MYIEDEVPLTLPNSPSLEVLMQTQRAFWADFWTCNVNLCPRWLSTCLLLGVLLEGSVVFLCLQIVFNLSSRGRMTFRWCWKIGHGPTTIRWRPLRDEQQILQKTSFVTWMFGSVNETFQWTFSLWKLCLPWPLRQGRLMRSPTILRSHTLRTTYVLWCLSILITRLRLHKKINVPGGVGNIKFKFRWFISDVFIVSGLCMRSYILCFGRDRTGKGI